MTLMQILLIDVRKEGNQEVLDKFLLSTEWGKNISEVTHNNLEKLYSAIERKYPVKIGYILRSDQGWTAMLKRSDNHKHIATIYGCNLSELFEKTIIACYGYLRKGCKLSCDEVYNED